LKRGTLVELPFSETPLTIHALCAHHAGKAISPAMRVFMQCMQEEQEVR
ncbi:LysR family transcriptional regulator, partial [Acinetobacter baumannii]|nr:LysR family transcriptional regulator [Acinetobacter baumannii]